MYDSYIATLLGLAQKAKESQFYQLFIHKHTPTNETWIISNKSTTLMNLFGILELGSSVNFLDQFYVEMQAKLKIVVLHL